MATLKIYKTQLTPARNALLDDIETYLDKIENQPSYYTGEDSLTYTDNNFQYIKPALDINIKINVPNNNNNLFDSIGNYVRIEQEQGADENSNSDDNISIWYYFIIGSRWIAQSTLELSLSLDTINTFGDFLLNEDSWSDKTNIIREHQDRFRVTGTSEFTKVVDRIGENITIPYLYKKNDIVIEEPNSTGTPEWYLVYQTDNASKSEGESGSSSNPLKCFVYPKTPILYQQNSGTSGSTFSKLPGDFADGNIYGITRGGVSFSNITITGRYFDYKHWEDTSIAVFLTGNNSGDLSLVSPTISGSVTVGDSFSKNGVTYNCFAVVWYKNAAITGDSSRMNLPIGLFTSSADSSVHYALYVTNINGTAYNEWFFFRRRADYLFGWHILQIFTRAESMTHGPSMSILGGGGDVLYGDSGTTSDNWLTQNFDSNWARNCIYCNSGTFTFTAETDFVYSIPYANKTPTAAELVSGTRYITNGTAGTYAQLSCIDYLDKEDPTLVKILAIPYCPTAITISTGSIESGDFTISFDPNIIEVVPETSEGYTTYFRLLYKNKQYNFGKDLLPIQLDYSPSEDFLNYYFDGVLKEKNILNESKLYASDFHKDNFVYDNVVKTIRQEDILTTEELINITPYYQPTNTLTSTIMYKFNLDNCNYAEVTDWDTVLISTRNNELPIYNNDYLNYMRYGYNAEKANLEATAAAQRQSYTTNAVFSIGGGTVGGAASGALMGAKVGGPWGAVAGGIIGGIVGLASSIIKTNSTINSVETNIANAQRSLASKVSELQNSAETVASGYSSVDLMTTYSGNRLHYITYDTPDLMKEAVWDKFFYCGYSHPVQDVPALDNRLCFNFVQCDPVFVNEATSKYTYYLTDIKDRFNSGVTIYHQIPNYLSTLDTTELLYDWKQQFENWEADFDRILPRNIMPMRMIHYPYTIAWTWVRQIGNKEDYSRFEPSANNTYRYKITYTVPGDDTEYDYPYANATDRQNGYTLSSFIVPTSDFDAAPSNGTIISVRIIDTTGTWKQSAPLRFTINNTFKYGDHSAVFTNPANTPTTVDGVNYYAWSAESSGPFSIVLYTDTRTPVTGNNVYNIIRRPGSGTEASVVGQITKLTVYKI